MIVVYDTFNKLFVKYVCFSIPLRTTLIIRHKINSHLTSPKLSYGIFFNKANNIKFQDNSRERK